MCIGGHIRETVRAPGNDLPGSPRRLLSQPENPHARARRPSPMSIPALSLGKESRPGFLYLRELGPVGEIGRGLDNIAWHATDIGKQLLDILEDLFRLSADIALSDNLLICVPCHLSSQADRRTLMLHHTHLEPATACLPDVFVSKPFAISLPIPPARRRWLSQARLHIIRQPLYHDRTSR